MSRPIAAAIALAALLAIPPKAISQSGTLAVNAAFGIPGSSIDIPVVFTKGADQVSDLQFQITFPGSSLSFNSVESKVAGKGTDFSYAIMEGMNVVLFGVEPATIDSGTVVMLHMMIRGNAAHGILPVRISNIVACDAQGNSLSMRGVDGFAEVLPTSATPMLISSVGAAEITESGATIIWTTNVPATTQADYGMEPNYTHSTATNPDLVFIHVQLLSGLAPSTTYRYRVRSTVSGNNSAAEQEGVFTTLPGNSAGEIPGIWHIPRISTQEMGLSGEEHFGLALVNLDSSPAILTITALSANGEQFARFGFSNPVLRTLKPGEKISLIDSELFAGSELPESIRSVKIASTSAKVSGFFVIYENALTRLDGAALLSRPLRSFLIPEIETASGTRIDAMNPGATDASVSLSLLNSRGELRGSAFRIIPPMGTAAVHADRNLFGISPESTDYVLGSASSGVLATELFKGIEPDVSVLAGIDAGVGSTRLFAPQFVYDSDWRSSLSILNLDPLPGWIRLDLIDETGISLGSWTRLLDAGGKVRLDDPADLGIGHFGGYLQITSNGIRIAGSATFGAGAAVSSLPLVSGLESSVLFSHLASDAVYYTGIAILNPNDTDVTATLILCNDAGMSEMMVQERIPARQRISRLLTDYFPVLAGQNRTSGYVRLMVDRPVASYAVYGTKNLSILCAIPGQGIR